MNVTGVELLWSFAEWVWQASCRGALLVPAVLVAQWAGRKVLSARWRNALWLLVVLRLLVPVLPATRFSVFNGLPRLSSTNPIPAAVPTLAIQNHLSETPAHPIASPNTGPSIPVESLSPPAPTATGSALHLPMLPMMWLLGCLAFAGSTLTTYRRLRRDVLRLRVSTPENVQKQFLELAGELGIRHADLVISGAVTTPFATGLWRARIVLPEGIDQKLAPEELRMILLHELGHVRRGDLWMAWISWLVTIVHWFNPIVRWSLARARQDRELACDEWALQFAPSARAYGAALVHFLELDPPPTRHLGLPAVGAFESNAALRQRIRRIANYRRPLGFKSVVGFSILAGAGLITLTDATDEKSSDGPVSSLRKETTQPLTPEDYKRTLRALGGAGDRNSWDRVRALEPKYFRPGVIFAGPLGGDEVQFIQPGYQFTLEDPKLPDLRQVDRRNLPSLYAAIEVGDPAIVRRLLQDGTPPNLPPNDETYLFGPLDLAKRLLEQNPKDEKRRQVIQTLLDYGANSDSTRTSVFPVIQSPEERTSRPHETHNAENSFPPAAENPQTKKVVATVNGEPITLAEVIAATPMMDRDSAEAREAALEKLIGRALLAQAARKKMDRSPRERIDGEIKAIVKQEFRGDWPAFEATLKKTGFTVETFKRFRETEELVQMTRRAIYRNESDLFAREEQVADWVAAERAAAKITYPHE